MRVLLVMLLLNILACKKRKDTVFGLPKNAGARKKTFQTAAVDMSPTYHYSYWLHYRQSVKDTVRSANAALISRPEGKATYRSLNL